jgi:hypothetical protein
MLVLGHEATHRAEPGEDQGMDRTFGSAGQNGVGVTSANQLGALTDRL